MFTFKLNYIDDRFHLARYVMKRLWQRSVIQFRFIYELVACCEIGFYYDIFIAIRLTRAKLDYCSFRNFNVDLLAILRRNYILSILTKVHIIY